MSAAPDSFLQKSSDELQYLVAHPELYHPSLVAEAGRELRRRGVITRQPDSAPVQPYPAETYDDDAPERSAVARWWPAGLLAVAVGGLAWWGLRTTTPAVVEVPKPAQPIVLEAVKANRMPDFEQETAQKIAVMRRLLPAADRADTTATGRYTRMARRYWLAESTAAYLTKQAQAKQVAETFPSQVIIGLEKITWFMKAKAYNQHLTPTMEARLELMKRGLVLRRNSLENLKTRYDQYGEVYFDKDLNRADFEAGDIGGELLGRPSKRTPMKGNISDL